MKKGIEDKSTVVGIRKDGSIVNYSFGDLKSAIDFYHILTKEGASVKCIENGVVIKKGIPIDTFFTDRKKSIPNLVSANQYVVGVRNRSGINRDLSILHVNSVYDADRLADEIKMDGEMAVVRPVGKTKSSFLAKVVGSKILPKDVSESQKKYVVEVWQEGGASSDCDDKYVFNNLSDAQRFAEETRFNGGDNYQFNINADIYQYDVDGKRVGRVEETRFWKFK